MPTARLLDARTTALVLVDLQEAFRPVIDGFDAVVARTAILAKGAGLLGIPTLVTEQVPQKLGDTIAEIKSVLPPGVTAREKTAFSCCGADSFVNELKGLRAVQQVILCGIETHVCVNQSAHDLMLLGYQVHLPLDCTSSRKPVDREAGLQKMMQSGVISGSSEMALFELTRDARHEQFKAISKLVK
jgi:nicotinamidase-related amidase